MVSSTCDSNESSTLHTLAMPPCAYAVLASELPALVSTVTVPTSDALSAKVRPAMPPPITRKSLNSCALCLIRWPQSMPRRIAEGSLCQFDATRFALGQSRRSDRCDLPPLVDSHNVGSR